MPKIMQDTHINGLMTHEGGLEQLLSLYGVTTVA